MFKQLEPMESDGVANARWMHANVGRAWAKTKGGQRSEASVGGIVRLHFDSFFTEAQSNIKSTMQTPSPVSFEGRQVISGLSSLTVHTAD
jgi:hypothetical protein